jgi:hypothetical protein
MHQTKDRCGKWMIDHHGDAILKMAKIDGSSLGAPPIPNWWRHADCRMA